MVFTEMLTDYGRVTKVPGAIISGDQGSCNLGETILVALGESKFLSDTSLAGSGPQFEAYLRSLGYKGWASFAKKVAMLSVRLQGNVVFIDAFEQDGKGNFILSRLRPIKCEPVADAVGRSVIEQKAKLKEYLTTGKSDPSNSQLPPVEAAADQNTYTPKIGDRVEDVWGNPGIVIKVDPHYQKGLGLLIVRYDDGREVSTALVAHDYKPVMNQG